MPKTNFLLISSDVLPNVFTGVIKAKELLANGEAKSTSQAAKMAGISRNAFYKYKDFVFKYSSNNEQTLSINAVLMDKAGVFSALSQVICEHKGNILTLNQNMPIDGTASVSLTISTENMKISSKELHKILTEVDGVLSIKIS